MTKEDLPDDFIVSEFTQLKSKGKLKFPSTDMFQFMHKTEHLITEYCKKGFIHESSSFQEILYLLREQELPKVGCDEQFGTVMSNLVFDYMVIRFKFIGRKTENGYKEKKHTHLTLSKK